MRKQTAKISILFLFVVFTLAAQLPVYCNIDAAADAVYLSKEISYTLDTDGGWVKEYRHTLKLNTFQAVSRYCGETFIEYNPRYQVLEVLKSETTMKDGKKVASTPNAYNEVLPHDAHHFAYYSFLREMVVTHLGLEREAVIDLHYRLKTKPGFMPYLSAREFIADRFPTKQLTITVSVPTGTPYNDKCFNTDVEGKVDTSGDRTIHRYTFKDLGAYLEEPLNESFSKSFIVFSTADKWEQVFPPLDSVGPLPQELVEKAEAMKNDVTGKAEFLFKLQEMVAGDIDSCDIGMDLNGFALRKLQDVYASNYGTAIEKAYLFHHLLTHFKIPSEITAIPKDKQFAPDVPTLFQFDGYLIKIDAGQGGPFYLSPRETGDHLFPYDSAGLSVYNLHQKTFQVIDTAGAGENAVNAVDISGKVTATKEKTSGELTVSLSGYFFPYRSTLEEGQKSLLNVVKGILPVSKLEIKKIALLTPEKMVAEVSVEGDLFKDVYYKRCMVEKFTFPSLEDEMISLKERKYPLHLEVPCDFRVELEVRLADGLEVTYSGPLVVANEDAAYYKQTVETPEPNVVMLKMALGIKKPVIEPTDYPGFKKVLDNYFIKEPLVVIK